MEVIRQIDRDMMRTDIPPMEIGDQLRVHTRVVEGDKERVQVYEGILIRRKNNSIGSSFTVRKVSYGVGVERIFPLHSPGIVKVEVVRQAKVRRAKLYYLRDLKGKASRLKERSWRQGQ